MHILNLRGHDITDTILEGYERQRSSQMNPEKEVKGIQRIMEIHIINCIILILGNESEENNKILIIHSFSAFMILFIFAITFGMRQLTT